MATRTHGGLLLSTALLLTACQALPASVRPYTPSFKLQAPAVAGASAGTVGVSDAVTLDDAGCLWAYATGAGGGEKDFIVRLSATGAVEAYYYVGANLNKTDLAVSADDHMWLIEATKGLIHLKLDPLGP